MMVVATSEERMDDTDQSSKASYDHGSDGRSPKGDRDFSSRDTFTAARGGYTEYFTVKAIFLLGILDSEK
jgi:hypothetical protein